MRLHSAVESLEYTVYLTRVTPGPDTPHRLTGRQGQQVWQDQHGWLYQTTDYRRRDNDIPDCPIPQDRQYRLWWAHRWYWKARSKRAPHQKVCQHMTNIAPDGLNHLDPFILT